MEQVTILFLLSLLLSLGCATFHSKLCLHFKVSSVGSHHLFHLPFVICFFVFCCCTSSCLVVTFLFLMKLCSLVQTSSASFGFIIATFLCYFFPGVI